MENSRHVHRVRTQPEFGQGMFFRNVTRRRILGILQTIAILWIAGCFTVISLVWCYHFFPDNRKEVIGPAGCSRRAFTENCGFVDISIVLQASDWPWTFWRPATLGDLYWPEVQKSSNVVWSMDGSVIAFQRHLNEDQTPLFSAAYDYDGHRLLEAGYDLVAREGCDQRIRTLLNDRGGVGPFQTGLDDEKVSSNELDAFPGWGLMVPGTFILGGGAIAWRLRR